MNDKKIRKILIAYLEANNTEIRIYQEKSIGNSICDIMTITNCLTGFEIKSDADNYRRLETQVAAYERFFDQNYIVVGESHRNSVYSRIPDNWGIIVISEIGVSIERVACMGKPSLRCQLQILWRIELKNILLRTNMPLFTYKSKGYVIERLMEYPNVNQIHEYLIYELMHRDYSKFNAKDYTIYSRKDSKDSMDHVEKTEIYEAMPISEIIDSLSEQNFGEITLNQWIDLYAQAKNVQQSKELLVRKVDVDRPQHTVSYKDIEVSPGVPWVSEHIISDFICFLRTGKERWECSLEEQKVEWIKYEPVTGYWYVEYKGMSWNGNCKYETRLEHEYGIPGYNALYIFEAILNLRPIKRVNESETIAILEKQEKIISLFKEWIWRDKDRQWEVEEAYNSLFKQFPNGVCDGAALQFPEMNKSIQLYPYQMDAVQKIITERNTLLAFDVGSGKTYIMIAAAMKMRQEGISNKNMFVVPNNIVGQWEIEFKKLYPQAKLLTIEPRCFRPEMRQKILRQIQQGNYDGIIIAYSCFEMIPLSSEVITEQMEKRVNQIHTALWRAYYASGIRGALEREKKYIKKITGELLEKDAVYEEGITFEQLEINSLFVDEAHNFKNIPIRSKLKNIAGINLKGSKKCLQMLHKVRYVQENNDGRGVIFATGTPLCNSISDAYAMQLYLQPDIMEKTHLDVFDNWVKSFAKPEMVCEIDVDTSKFRFVNRLSRFFNLPELSRMFSSVAIFHAMEEDANLPQMKGYDEILIRRNDALQNYMDILCHRTEEIRSKKISKHHDNMLKVSIDGRKAALDLRLVQEEQPYNEYSKIYQCVQNVMQIYQEFPESTQIVFCDYSTPKKEKFNIYSELKEHFLENGVDKKEIAFIHSYTSEATKVALYDKVNSGKVRILIGSTFKLGIGANVQRLLKAIHHLDVPWRPSDMVQREGRIIRKGNTNSEVKIFRYIAEGSFDAYSWQILETKQKFISQFLTGTLYQRTESDLEENVLSYAQVKALAIAEPLMKNLAEKENELSRVQILSNNFAQNQSNAKKQLEELTNKLQKLEVRYKNTVENNIYLKSISLTDYQHAYQEICEVYTENVILQKSSLPRKIQVVGFSVFLPDNQDEKHPYVYLERLGTKYAVEMGTSAIGNARRIINYLKQFSELPKELENKKNETKVKISELKKVIAGTNPYITEINSLKQEVKKLKVSISQNR